MICGIFNQRSQSSTERPTFCTRPGETHFYNKNAVCILTQRFFKESLAINDTTLWIRWHRSKWPTRSSEILRHLDCNIAELCSSPKIILGPWLGTRYSFVASAITKANNDQVRRRTYVWIGPVLDRKMAFLYIKIHVTKIMRSWDRIIFMTNILILKIDILYWKDTRPQWVNHNHLNA